MEFDLEDPFMSFKQQEFDSIETLFSAESAHMSMQEDYNFLRAFRLEAIALFLQLEYSCNLDPFTTYLSVNYMDRFLSKKEIPQGKPWVLRLIVISCLSLAAKMREREFLSSDFQNEEGFIFDIQTIQRMELVILDALNWRMRSITPFSFIQFFISFFEFKDSAFKKSLKSRAISIIFKDQNQTDLLPYKPSTMAASSLLLASHELFPLQFQSFKDAVSSCEYVNKERLLNCFNAMQEMVINEGNESGLETISGTRTPLSILDWPCKRTERSRSQSQSTTITSNSDTATPEKRETKRHKINEFSTQGNRVQISQVQ